MARPKTWTVERIKEYKEKILFEIAFNGHSLVRICSWEDYPSNVSVYEWLSDDNEFANRYARACEIRADKMADDILTICDSTEDDIIIDSDGNHITNHNVIQRDKLRVDTRKWLLSKLAPKKYGDKIDVTTGGDKVNNLTMLQLPDFMEKK